MIPTASALPLRTATPDETEELRRIGCRHGQGFFFGRPQPPEHPTTLGTGLDGR